jgi:hypothetical protein
VFVDYDNIYLSLKRKSEDAAKRFAKDAGLWLREIESGRLISSSTGANFNVPRRIVMTRCYGNPVPRRNSNDNSTDMNSFPFVRHHFLRAGFEVIDCPPLTAQLKNSADIRMVMDVRDVLNHDTRFDEFILLSGDADFTPVLHRLRAHARRTVVFANDHTAAPYTAIADGEVRESDLIALLLEGRISDESEPRVAELRGPSTAELEVLRKEIVAEVVASVRAAAQPVPLEALADRAVRALGHDKTVGSAWGGAGSFRDLLAKGLPGTVRLTDQPPYYAYETTRQIAQSLDARPEPREQLRDRRNDTQEARPEARAVEMRAAPRTDGRPDLRYDLRAEPQRDQRFEAAPEIAPPRQDRMLPPAAARPTAPQSRPLPPQDGYGDAFAARPQQQIPPVQAAPRRPAAPQPQGYAPASQQSAPLYAPQPSAPAYAPQQQPQAPRPQHYAAQEAAPAARAQAPQQARAAEGATQLQQSIARIHEACQAPPLSPPEYRVLFEVMAEEINANNLSGAQTLVNIGQRALDMGLDIKRDDIRFVLEVVSEADPWFEQGASSNLFASRFRNFVVARCRGQGLSLSADEIDLIDAWFGGAGTPVQRGNEMPANAQAQVGDHMNAAPNNGRQGGDRWATYDDGRQQAGAPQAQVGGFGAETEEEFPRIVRSGLRR